METSMSSPFQPFHTVPVPQDLLISVGFPEATMQHLGSRVVDLLPAVEAAALAQRAHGVGEGVVHVMEPTTTAPGWDGGNGM